MPSYFESLSMVALEAWALGKPVLANGHCDVLHGPVHPQQRRPLLRELRGVSRDAARDRHGSGAGVDARPERPRVFPPALHLADHRAEVPRHARATRTRDARRRRWNRCPGGSRRRRNVAAAGRGGRGGAADRAGVERTWRNRRRSGSNRHRRRTQPPKRRSRGQKRRHRDRTRRIGGRRATIAGRFPDRVSVRRGARFRTATAAGLGTRASTRPRPGQTRGRRSAATSFAPSPRRPGESLRVVATPGEGRQSAGSSGARSRDARLRSPRESRWAGWSATPPPARRSRGDRTEHARYSSGSGNARLRRCDRTTRCSASSAYCAAPGTSRRSSSRPPIRVSRTSPSITGICRTRVIPTTS